MDMELKTVVEATVKVKVKVKVVQKGGIVTIASAESDKTRGEGATLQEALRKFRKKYQEDN